MEKLNHIFYFLLSPVLKWWKQRKCEHNWLPKGNAIDNQWTYFHEHRCPKCKLIKQTWLIKDASKTGYAITRELETLKK